MFGACVLYVGAKKINPNPRYTVGQRIDSLNGVMVYYNGGVSNVEERNLAADGYNLGLKYQCVEFVKRYYYQYYGHKMPDSYGNAKDFFDVDVENGKFNSKSGLVQFKNPAPCRPQVGDLLIFDGHAGNIYGHVAIISAVKDDEIELTQQNPGPFAPSREKLSYKAQNAYFQVEHPRLLGWLRKISD
jgi:surface antigen